MNTRLVEPGPYHRARLVGSYHAYRAAATADQMSRWCLSLTYEDLKFLELYERAGKWGETSLRKLSPLKITVRVEGIPALQEALQKTADAAFQLSQSFANALPEGLLADIRQVEQAHFQFELERLFIPPRIAERISQHWPADWLPSRLNVRYDDFRHDLAMALRRLAKRIDPYIDLD